MTTPRPDTIPTTPLFSRYWDLRHRRADGSDEGVSYARRRELAEADRDQPAALAQAFTASVEAFGTYENRDQPFHDGRNAPERKGEGTGLVETDDVAARLCEAGGLTVEPRDGAGATRHLSYVDRELVPVRTTGENSHRRQKAKLLRLDLLLRDDAEGIPVIGELKTPSDVDSYVALIQALAVTAQLVTEPQRARLRGLYEPFDSWDSGVEIAILAVSLEHAGQAKAFDKPRAYADRNADNEMLDRPKIDAAVEPIAQGLMADARVAEHVRRISLLELRLQSDDTLSAHTRWSYSAGV